MASGCSRFDSPGLAGPGSFNTCPNLVSLTSGDRNLKSGGVHDGFYHHVTTATDVL